MTDSPKMAPTETEESGHPVEADKHEAAGPAEPIENKPAAEPATAAK